MSREHLYKGKSKRDGQWVIGSYVNVGNGVHQIWVTFSEEERAYHKGTAIEGDYGYWEEIIPETLCEFTGLRDKNGKRIWENDIIFDTYYKKLGVVKFGMGTFDSGIYRYYGWHYESEGSVDHHELYKYDELVDFEVLGNRFDNAELLTAERISENEN